MTEIFDWIVGTSTGGILALGLVYGECVHTALFRSCISIIKFCCIPTCHACFFRLLEYFFCVTILCENSFNVCWISNTFFLFLAKKSLSRLRQLYFRLKDRVFSEGRLGFAYNTASLEKILKEEFGTDALLSDVKHPKYEPKMLKCISA